MFSVFLQRTKELPWRKLVKFVVTGGVALGIDVSIYYALTRFGGMYYLFARVISLGIAIVWNFTVNRHWTFEATAGKVREQAPRFLVVITVTSLLSLALMHVGVSFLHFYDLVVILFVSALIMLINFSAHSCWSYAKRN